MKHLNNCVECYLYVTVCLMKRGKTVPRIILASSSQVRRDVLKELRIAHAVYPSSFKEHTKPNANESFEDFAKRLALGKARDVASKLQHAMVIAADSFAVLNGEVMGKPHTKKIAVQYLTRLSNRTHEFYTGIAVVDTNSQKEVTDCAKAIVSFRNLTQKEIKEYVEREDVTNAGGAYRIQKIGATLINAIQGDYYAIVGISPSKLATMLKRMNYNLFDYISPLTSKIKSKTT